jgi:SET domain-containing protein
MKSTGSRAAARIDPPDSVLYPLNASTTRSREIPETKPSKVSRKPFRIGRSVTGLGLFATRLIKKRTRIAQYRGPLLTDEEAERAGNRGNRYLFEINSRWTIDGKSRKNIARYANHSCNPNAEPIIRGHQIFINAKRDIKPGEEIVYDYGPDYLKNVIGRNNCKCSRCRRRKAKLARERRLKAKRKASRKAARLAGGKAKSAKGKARRKAR